MIGMLPASDMTHVSMAMKRFAELLVAIVLFTTFIGCRGKPDVPNKDADTLPTENIEGEVIVPRPEMTLQIRHPWNRGDAVQVRLDIDRLRACGLSKEDVMEALRPSRIVDPREPLPPPGVVFDPRLLQPDQYGNIILKANADGELVRLKDVAKVELLAGHEAQAVETDHAGK